MSYIYRLLSYCNSKLRRFGSKRLLAYLIISLLVLLVLSRFVRLFFILFMIFLGALSLIHTRFFRYSHYIGFELCTMATVLTALKYGAGYGVVTGFFSITLAFIFSGFFKPNYFISILILPLMGLIVPLFAHLDLFYIGMLITILYDAIILPLYITIGGSRIITSTVFFVTHVLLNAWIFSGPARLLYTIM